MESRKVRVYVVNADGDLEIVRAWPYGVCVREVERGHGRFIRIMDGGHFRAMRGAPGAFAYHPDCGFLPTMAPPGITDTALRYRDARDAWGEQARAAAEGIRQALRDMQPTRVSCQRR